MMKKLFVILWFVSLAFLVNGQTLSLETFVQESAIGMQKGYSIHYVNRKGWALGTVFQSTDGFTTESNGTNYPFYGIEARLPIQNCGRLRLQFAPKLGFVNRDFLVFLPELQTEYLVTNSLGLGMGAGIRVREAAVSFKVFFQPFKKLKS